MFNMTSSVKYCCYIPWMYCPHRACQRAYARPFALACAGSSVRARPCASACLCVCVCVCARARAIVRVRVCACISVGASVCVHACVRFCYNNIFNVQQMNSNYGQLLLLSHFYRVKLIQIKILLVYDQPNLRN